MLTRLYYTLHYVVCTVTYNALVRDDVILLCLASERKVIGAVTCVSESLAHNQLIIVWEQVQYTVHSTQYTQCTWLLETECLYSTQIVEVV